MGRFMAEGAKKKIQKERKPGVMVGNLGEPIRLKDVNIAGFSAEAVEGGKEGEPDRTVSVWTRLSLTSDDPMFFQIVEGLATFIQSATYAVEQPVMMCRHHSVLMVIKPDQSAELWADTAATSLSMMPRRNMTAGSVVFEHDIVDVTGLSFPLVSIEPGDRVIYLFREGWRFGLHFDLGGVEDVAELHRELGSLFRGLRYRHLYDQMANPELFARMTKAGWFPFAEIVGPEVRGLLLACENGFDLAEEEQKLLAKFDEARIGRILDRWLARPHFKTKEKLLRSAMDAFNRGDSVAVIKTLVTEIEGILCDAHASAIGTRGKLGAALEFAAKRIAEKAGSPSTLMFPDAFGRYLKASTFADFDPVSGAGQTSSRHAVGHGAAPEDSYTELRALQVILTLDQFAFYI